MSDSAIMGIRAGLAVLWVILACGLLRRCRKDWADGRLLLPRLKCFKCCRTLPNAPENTQCRRNYVLIDEYDSNV